MDMPQPNSEILSKKAEITAALRAVFPEDAVIDDPSGRDWNHRTRSNCDRDNLLASEPRQSVGQPKRRSGLAGQCSQHPQSMTG